MKNRIILIIIAFNLTFSVLYSEGVRFDFQHGAKLTLGATPIMRNVDNMYYFALEQAAIFATKLDKSFCIFHYATLEREYDQHLRSESATFIVNVVADWDMLLDYLDFLDCVAQEYFHGYYLLLFDIDDIEPNMRITKHTDPINEMIPQISLTGNTLSATATARHTRLDEAIDEAFKYALSEISKYQDINIRSMYREILAFSEHAILQYAENIVSDVYFAEIDVYFGRVSNMGYYTTKVVLEKRL
jgi:hypothetical protein